MGVQGLWSIIQPTAQHTPLDELKGLRIAIDLAIWVVDDMQTQREAACAIPGRLHLRNLVFRTLHLLKLGILPLFIVDGEAPELKVATMTARSQKVPFYKKAAAAKQADKPAGPLDSERIRKRAKFRRLLSGDCCRLLDLLGVPHVESPGEAESLAALLNSRGLVDAVITNDGDAFLYGAKRVLRNFSMDSRDAHVDSFDSGRLAAQLGLSRDRLVALALLLGCDYAPGGTPGVGPALALKFFRCLPPDADATLRLLEAGCGGGIDADGCGVIRRFLAASATLAAAPDIVKEFLEVNRTWPTLIDKDRMVWRRRPRPLEFVKFCRDKLEWAEEYAVAKLLPLLCAWDEERAGPSNQPVGLKPRRILAERVRAGVPCYELEFHKLEFDIWTEAEFYTLCVPRHPFGELNADILTSFEQQRLQEKADKLKAKQQQKKKKTKATDKQQTDVSKSQMPTKKIKEFFLTQPVPVVQPCRRRSVLVDSLSDLFADISLSTPAVELPADDGTSQVTATENFRQPFSHLFVEFPRDQPLAPTLRPLCQFRLDSSLLDSSPAACPRAPASAPASAHASGQGPAHASGQTSAHASGQTSAHASGQTSAHASGQTSAHASGQTSAHASGQISARASGQISAHASGQTSAHASGQTSAHASGQKSAHASGQAPAMASTPTSGRAPTLDLPSADLRRPQLQLDDSFDKFKTPPRLAARLRLLYSCSKPGVDKPLTMMESIQSE